MVQSGTQNILRELVRQTGVFTQGLQFEMSAKKGRKAKATKDEGQKVQPMEDVGSPNLSAMEIASFMDGLQQNFDYPLHSTALEEDLNAAEGQKCTGTAGRKGVSKTFVKQHGAAVKRKEMEKDLESGKEEAKRKRSRRSTEEKTKSGPERAAETKKNRQSDAKKRSAGQMAAGRRGQINTRQEKKQRAKKDKKRESRLENEKAGVPQPQVESDTELVRQRRRPILSSDEDEVDDASWKPSPKKAKEFSLGKTRKSSSDRAKSTSSSGSASEEEETADKKKQKRKKKLPQRGTELEVVLDAFTDFCDEYRESVESKAVKQAIDSFATNVKQQLMEKISSYKELRVLQRENVKVASSIRKKTQKMVDAKHEMMRAERQLTLLKREKTELKLRLADLRQSQALLHDLRELNRLYLDHRHKQPKKKETYGASSESALKLEAEIIQAAERQQKGKEDGLGKRQKKKKTGTQK